MATDKEKKNWGQVARHGYDQYANETTAAGEQAANDLSAAGQQQVTDLTAANKGYSDALNAAQQQYRQQMDKGYTQFYDIIADEGARALRAEQEALDQRKAELSAARWTGATELAASVANLIGVGGFNAANQQYKPYSQDWMRKAEENWRINRARFDNMRDRQRALQQQMIQMRANDAGHTLSAGMQAAGAKHQGDVALAGARYNAAAAPVNIRFQTAEKAAEAKAKGAVTEATMGQQKDAQDAQIGLGYARLNEGKRQHDAEMQYKYDMQGWTTDPKTGARVAPTGGGSGKNSKTALSFNLLEYKQNGQDLPAENITVPDEATLRNTLFANIDAVTDLSDAQKNSIKNLMDDDTKDGEKKAKELTRYLVSSGQLRSLLRGSNQSSGASASTSGRAASSIAGELRGDGLSFDDEPQGTPISDDLSMNSEGEKEKWKGVRDGNQRRIFNANARNALIKAERRYREATGIDTYGKNLTLEKLNTFDRMMDAGRGSRGTWGGRYWDKNQSDAYNILHNSGFSKLIPYVDADDLEILNGIMTDAGTLSRREYGDKYSRLKILGE